MKNDSVIKEDDNSISSKTEIVMVSADTKAVSDKLMMMSHEPQWTDINFYSQDLSNQSVSSISISSQNL